MAHYLSLVYSYLVGTSLEAGTKGADGRRRVKRLGRHNHQGKGVALRDGPTLGQSGSTSVFAPGALHLHGNSEEIIFDQLYCVGLSLFSLQKSLPL